MRRGLPISPMISTTGQPGATAGGTTRRDWLRAAGTAAALALARPAGLAGLGALASGTACAAGDAATLRIGYQKYGNFVVLKARGTLEKRLAPLGVGVRWIEFPGGPQLLEGLAAGALDIGTVGETPPIFAQAGKVDFVYIGAEPPAPKGEAIVVPRDSPIRGVAGLRGKKVALNRGSNVHYLLVKALQAAKLDYRDIEPVYLAPADGRAAFEQRGVDAWVIWDPYLAAVERQTGARTLANGEGLVRNTQYYLASRPFATARPEIVRAVLAEIDATDAWARDHVPEVAAQLAPLVGLDAPTLELALGRAAYRVEPISDATLAYQQQVADAFTALKLIPGRLDVTQARWTAR
ncbi:Putative aliphatic sulfonates-binding protein [Burkholderia glumae]|nr:ABC transporter, substrate-binding, aliphatic sulfonates family protein [Burkholderia glumae LMG 2196 = ATCC 33617]QKM49685.1 Putative aliphatic sulfonates-binding protein [Burkholderia glumae]QKM56344.1 Putative aliphatic sulfonates-binding protein [Burkholderia glumae]QTP36506.1 Putative aliphatic sulfonates-binding protein [Burkholderia glumae]